MVYFSSAFDSMKTTSANSKPGNFFQASGDGNREIGREKIKKISLDPSACTAITTAPLAFFTTAYMQGSEDPASLKLKYIISIDPSEAASIFINTFAKDIKASRDHKDFFEKLKLNLRSNRDRYFENDSEIHQAELWRRIEDNLIKEFADGSSVFSTEKGYQWVKDFFTEERIVHLQKEIHSKKTILKIIDILRGLNYCMGILDIGNTIDYALKKNRLGNFYHSLRELQKASVANTIVIDSRKTPYSVALTPFPIQRLRPQFQQMDLEKEIKPSTQQYLNHLELPARTGFFPDQKPTFYFDIPLPCRRGLIKDVQGFSVDSNATTILFQSDLFALNLAVQRGAFCEPSADIQELVCIVSIPAEKLFWQDLFEYILYSKTRQQFFRIFPELLKRHKRENDMNLIRIINEETSAKLSWLTDEKTYQKIYQIIFARKYAILLMDLYNPVALKVLLDGFEKNKSHLDTVLFGNSNTIVDISQKEQQDKAVLDQLKPFMANPNVVVKINRPNKYTWYIKNK